MIAFMKNRFDRFARDTQGSASVEAMIIGPLLVGVLVIGVSIFDAFRAQSTAEKAAYAVSDMISRETLEITPEYVTNMRKIFRDLSGLSNAETALRITMLRWDAEVGKFYVDWAKRRGDIPKLRNRDVADYDELLPELVHNERVILVETATDYKAMSGFSVGERTIETFIFTRPRYAPQLVWNDNG